MEAVRRTGRGIWIVVRWPIAIVAILLFGAGVPYLWVWVGSQLQGGTAPSFSGLGVALLGIGSGINVVMAGLEWGGD